MDVSELDTTLSDQKAQERLDRILADIDREFPFKICGECDTLVETGDSCPSCGSNDLSNSFREHQREMLVEAATALYIEDVDNVIMEGPTGIGKSAINYVLGLISGSAFYTTPQKSLRNQLADDRALEDGMHALRGRADYTCGETGSTCDDCEINRRDDLSCKNQASCTYWNNKMRAIHSPIAATTFAYLIVDNYLPPIDDQGDRISFEDRDLVIVDEGHTLESQVASMFAGTTISPWSVPPEVYQDSDRVIEHLQRRHRDLNRWEQVSELVDDIAERARQFVERWDGHEGKSELVEDCESFLRKHEWIRGEVQDGRQWVVDVGEVDHPEYGPETPSLELKPVKVDSFLQNFVWSRGRKTVLSTATMPYRNKPDEWTDRLGLKGETRVIRRPMPFPTERRPIHTDTIIDSFSGGGDDENWEEIVDQVRELSERHDGRGLIHTASYNRAERLSQWLPEIVMADEQGVDSDEMVDRWQNSDYQVLASPAMSEGVDLKHDLAHWQVLLKVPYPNSHADARVDYLLNEDSDWEWYFQETGLKLWQSYGRAMRAADDWQDYYVLDGSFTDVVSRTDPPNWIMEAVTQSGSAVTT